MHAREGRLLRLTGTGGVGAVSFWELGLGSGEEDRWLLGIGDEEDMVKKLWVCERERERSRSRV